MSASQVLTGPNGAEAGSNEDKIRRLIWKCEKGMCSVEERQRCADEVLQLGAYPECAEWAKWFAATRQWNMQQQEAREAWRARWAPLRGWSHSQAEMIAEREKMLNERMARSNSVTHDELVAMTPLELVDLENIPYWLLSIPFWIKTGYDVDNRAGRAYTRLPSRDAGLVWENP